MSSTKPPPSGATLRQVAEAAGVSIATASRVLNGIAGKATADTVARVRAAAERLAYRPLAAARELRLGRGELVALLAPNLANPTMAAIAASIEAALRSDGIGVILCDTHDEAALQDLALDATRALRPRATVFLGVVPSPGLVALRASGEPALYVARRCPGAPDAPFVGIDDRAAGAEVARRLLADGARRLAVIHGPLFSAATADRVNGFGAVAGKALARANLLGGDGLDHLRIGEAAARRLLRRAKLPDGLMCTSDLIAFAVHRTFIAAGGTGLPRIWGFDGGPLNAWVAPWLSSVALPYEAFGAAVRRWVGTPEDGSGAILPHRLEPAHPPWEAAATPRRTVAPASASRG